MRAALRTSASKPSTSAPTAPRARALAAAPRAARRGVRVCVRSLDNGNGALAEQEKEAPSPPGSLPVGNPADARENSVPKLRLGGDVGWAGAPDRTEAPSYEIAGCKVPTSVPRFSYLYIASNLTVLALLAATDLSEPGRGSALALTLANDSAAVWGGDYARLLTSSWLFADPVSLVLNTLAMLSVGPEVEALLGYTRFNYVTIVSAIAGATATLVDNKVPVSVGGSGVLLGLLGALLAYTARNGAVFFRPLQLTAVLGVLSFDIYVGSQPETLVDNASHAAAALYGLALGIGLGPDWEPLPGPEGTPVIVVDKVPYDQKLYVGLGGVLLLMAVLASCAPGGLQPPTSLGGYWDSVAAALAE